MEFLNNLIYCVSQTMGIIPMIFQVPGLLGCIQSSCSILMNVLHCTFFGGIAMEDIVMPAFNKMGDLFVGDK